MQNLISVIIVNYNGGRLLSDCIRSVLASTIPVEVIVSDNLSTDYSLAEVRRQFPLEDRLRIIENADNFGFAQANNIALPDAHGDYILFLNPDCIIRPDTLSRMLAEMEGHPEVGMAGCLIRNPDGSEQAGCRRSVPTPWRTFIRLSRLYRLSRYHPRFRSYVQSDLPLPERPAEVEAISGAFMLVRRSAIERIGPMDEGYFMHCEDLDWCMRFRQAGLSILFVPTIDILHVGGVCTASRPILVEYYKHRGMVRFYQKFFRHQYPSFLMWLVLLAIGIRFLARTAVLLVEPRKIRREIPFSVSGWVHNNGVAPADHRGRVMVTGATSLIGDFLLPALVRAGFEVHAISRKPPVDAAGPSIVWHKGDISRDSVDAAFGAEVVIHLAPLWTLPPLLAKIASDRLNRIIAFSSTSLFTKQNSGYEKERMMATNLEQSERQLREECARRGIRFTIFRPTLVYSLGRDKNVTTIARFIRRFGFFPIVGEGNGLRQPVHAEDLARACVAVLDNSRTFGKSYNLSGGEILTYRQMVQRIFSALKRTSRIVTIPLPMLRLLLRSLSYLPLYRNLTPEMANRINLNMCFDHSEATRDFGFHAREFFPPEWDRPGLLLGTPSSGPDNISNHDQ